MQLLGALYAQAGARSKHEQFCEQAIARFKNADDPHPLERTTKMYLSLPPLPDSRLLADAVKMARRATDVIEQVNPYNLTYMAFNRAMAEYRLGQFEEAQHWLAKSDRPQAIPFRAMVAHQLGNHQEARDILRRAEETIGSVSKPDSPSNWHDHLFTKLSLKEARELIDGR